MSKTGSTRIEGKKVSATSGQKKHDERIGKQPKYVNTLRSDLNSIIISSMTGPMLRNMCIELREQTKPKRALRSNAHVSYSGIITFGTEAQPIIEGLDVGKQNELFEEIASNIAVRFDAELTGLSVHRDETSIHAHYQMPGFNNQGVPLSKMHVPYTELQDITGKALNHLGITRGKKKVDRIKDGEPTWKYIHKTVRQLHEGLPRELALLNELIDNTAEGERAAREDLIERQIQLKELSLALTQVMAEKSQTDGKVIRAGLELNGLKKEVDTIKHEVKEQTDSLGQIKEKIARASLIEKENKTFFTDLSQSTNPKVQDALKEALYHHKDLILNNELGFDDNTSSTT